MIPEKIPDGFVKYSESPVFTQDTVPAKLQKDHDTKAGVWGKLIVSEGALDYVLAEFPNEMNRVAKGEHIIIEPTVLHHVKLAGDVKFQLEFYRAPKQ